MKSIARWLALALLLSFAVPLANAQTATAVPTVTGPTSNVAIFYVACLDSGVVNFTGQMQAGYDVYYQLYSAVGGTGTALSGLRRAIVNGSYAFSEVVTYVGGTVPAGQVGSIAVSIARESDATRKLYSTTVNDLQDGCAAAQNPLGSSSDLGGAGTAGTPDAIAVTPILSPFGGELNPGYNPRAQTAVVIGPRDFSIPRQQTAGLIFAECNQYPVALPGVIYDTDRIVIFWSWFAKTAEQVQAHIDNAQYEVQYFGNSFVQPVTRTPIQKRGTNWYVFYYVDLGKARPDTYYIGYKVTWANAITDGYDDFGPGTGNEQIAGNCDFTVSSNPTSTTVEYTFP
ncbi:MAG: hypothetical protein IPK52_10895 [Chloroflexi bacterium]|nr:hypothetical protein [Chloroflexota bacterium]